MDLYALRRSALNLCAGAVLVAAMICGASDPSAAQSLRKSHPNHIETPSTRSPSPDKSPRMNKPHSDPFKAGVIWRVEGSFAEMTQISRELSQGCRRGIFGRIAGGFADFDNLRVPAAPVRGLYNPTRLQVFYPVYFFRYEHTTHCKVYVPR